jgi:hypothetical protein
MKRFKTNQKLLFKAETVFNLRPLEKYEIHILILDTSPFKMLYPSTGRPPIPYEALFKALVYKNIKNVSYISDLVRELWSSPDKTDTQLSDHGHFFVFLRTIIPEKRM